MITTLLMLVLVAYGVVSFVSWLKSLLIVCPKQPLSSDPARRLFTVSQSNLIGLPSRYFADDEVMGQRVRLLTEKRLSEGYCLQRGECFVVSGIAIEKFSGRAERYLLLTNHRAKQVPVRSAACELLFCWPEKMEGKPDGKSTRGE